MNLGIARFLMLLVLFAATVAHAQSYPAKPVRIVVGFSAGGSIDIVGRRLAQKLGESLGQQFIIMTTGINIVHVPYKGGAPALADLAGGQIDIMIDTIPTAAIQYIEAGKLRALAVTSPRRTNVLPSVPTMEEAGLKGFEFRTWMGLAAPAGTAKDIIARLNAATNQALTGGDLRVWLEGLGVEVAGGTPEQFQKFLQQEIALYARIVKASGMPLL